MGEAALRSDVCALRTQLEAVQGGACVQRIDIEGNVVEFKISDVGGEAGAARRFSFLIYDADSYPDSGGTMMAEDERHEVLVAAINERLGEPDRITVAEALHATLHEMGHTDFSASLRSASTGAQARSGGDASGGNASPADALAATSCDDRSDAELDDLEFEGDDEETSVLRLDVLDRENRPGWKRIRWNEREECRVAQKEQRRICSQKEVPGYKRRKANEEKKAADEQMWSSKEAFTILSNELYQIQTEQVSELEADAVEYDVHRWRVLFRGCGGALGEDLVKLQARHGYDYIELHLTFKEDLHPFYPPTASIMRPRLHGEYDVLSALACHPRLQLRGWSPFQTAKDLLMSIKRFLSNIARVDLENEQNDLRAYPDGAFSPLERQLAQLGSLCEVVPPSLRLDAPRNPYRLDPWAQREALTQTSLGSMLTRKKAAPPSTMAIRGSKTFWAAGTGYGHGEENYKDTWDPQAMIAAQVAQDEELRSLVRGIGESLRSAVAAAGGDCYSGSTSSRKGASASQLLSSQLSKSCLAPFLARELSISYTSIGDRLPFFQAVLELLQEILNAHEYLELGALTVLQHVSEELQSLKASAKTFLQSLGGSAGLSDVAEDVAFAKLAERISDEVQRILACRSAFASVESSEARASLAAFRGMGSGRSAGDTVGAGDADFLCSVRSDVSMPSASPACSSTSPASPPDEVTDVEYCKRLKKYQLDQADFGTEHAFANEVAQEHSQPQARTLRLAKELAGIVSLLPLSPSSSVFVRVDEGRQQLWRVLITGPDDTPYSNGCFVFDIYFPVMYPREPPRVKLLTTGHNTVTFNPNLYDSGKVCLSLLGTWRGEKAENWDPTNSRIAQVLVSIQSLILVPEPYFNEPGYEREIGTSVGESRSRQYNQVIRTQCVKWAMVDHLQRRRFAEFADVIREHFQSRKTTVLSTVQLWAEQAGNAEGLQEQLRTLTRLIEELPEGEVARLALPDSGHGGRYVVSAVTAGSGEAPDEG
eukprot:TRINITY_DN14189_c2_g4_i2.p1 TRINITY_DN14189_c2_g4~~TRINITY_DN14189_c2_g4_i2.p1  ORF type:complete len:1011 (+),score=171.29 TRINITY_DN14189_c2_g4_i2:45-3035(+)